jgi:hypothetical protein
MVGRPEDLQSQICTCTDLFWSVLIRTHRTNP